MKELSFRRGVHVPDKKAATADKPIEIMPQVDTYYFSLQQHMGAPAIPKVKEGDRVLRGMLIGEAAGAFSSNIYSSVSGTVKGIIKKNNNLNVPTDYIVVENDRQDETMTLPVIEPVKENILDRIFEAGIVGMGGAGFPTSIKLKPKTPVDTLVINGAECEPYLNCDNRVMIEYTEKLVKGITLIAKALEVKEAYIGIETNKPEAIEAMKKATADITVVPLKKKYPQGAEKQLIYAVTGRIVKCGGLWRYTKQWKRTHRYTRGS